MAETRTTRTQPKKKRNPLGTAITTAAAKEGASSLLSSGAEPIGSTVLADGTPGFLMSDGTVVAQAGTPWGPIAIGAAITANRGYEAFNRGQKSNNPLNATLDEFKNIDTIEKNPLLFPLNPMFAGAGSVASSLGIGNKSTKEYQADRTKDLLRMGYTPEQINPLRNPQPSPKGTPSWDTNDMSNPLNLWGSEGMLKYGPDYLNKLSEQDRYALTKYAIDKGYFKDDKGDKVIRDEDMADIRANEQSILQNQDYIKQYNNRGETYNPLATDPTKSHTTSMPQAGEDRSSASLGSPYTAVGEDGVRRNVAPGTHGTPEAPADNKMNALKMMQSLIPGQEGARLNEIPEFSNQPVLQTPQDFTNAYLGIVERNTGNQIFNPLARRM